MQYASPYVLSLSLTFQSIANKLVLFKGLSGPFMSLGQLLG